MKKIKYLLLIILCLTWVIYFKNGDIVRAKELIGNQWASSTVLCYIDDGGHKTYVNWVDINKVVEE